MVVEVQKEDILKIGDTIFNLEGFTMLIIENDNSFWVKEILLRNILKAFFNNYQITSIEDYELDQDGYEVTKLIIKTNLPWEEFQKLKHTD